MLSAQILQNAVNLIMIQSTLQNQPEYFKAKNEIFFKSQVSHLISAQ